MIQVEIDPDALEIEVFVGGNGEWRSVGYSWAYTAEGALVAARTMWDEAPVARGKDPRQVRFTGTNGELLRVLEARP